MFLLVGLGNYGIEYLNTKHNYGFLLIDKIIARYKFIEQKNKFQSISDLSWNKPIVITLVVQA